MLEETVRARLHALPYHLDEYCGLAFVPRLRSFVCLLVEVVLKVPLALTQPWKLWGLASWKKCFERVKHLLAVHDLCYELLFLLLVQALDLLLEPR